jgi:hypothetical protein
MDDSELRQRDFFKKLCRGEQHIQDLGNVVARYQDSHPYEMRKTVTRKKEVWRMHITEQPPATAALILGDALYNLRASLDYLIGECCIKRDDAGSAYFPIPAIRERIWEIPEIEGESEERSRQRRNWAFFERAMPAGVLTLLKGLEIPKDGVPIKGGERINYLVALNALANKDRHTRLNVIASGLHASTVWSKALLADGLTQVFGPGDTDSDLYEDGAIVAMPPGVVKVEIYGTVKVVVPVGPQSVYAAIPDAIEEIRQFLVSLSAQFVEHLRRDPVR